MHGLHLVQVGQDDGVFSEANSEALRRQLRYAEILEELEPGSRITTVVLTKNSGFRERRSGSAVFVPLAVNVSGARKVIAWSNLVRELWRIHRERRIDALTTQTVHDEAWPALLFSKAIGARSVGQVHYDVFSRDAQRDVSRTRASQLFRFALMNRMLPHFTAIRTVGQNTATRLVRELSTPEIRVIPVRMEMLAQRAPTDGGQRPRTVLFVGRLVPAKGLETWAEVAAIVLRTLEDVRFHIVGAGPLEEPLARRFRDLGIAGTVTLSGFVEYERLPKVYEESSVFLLTSRYEGFGRVVVEALSRATPVVATRITGVEDIVVEGRSGFLHEAGDVDGLAGSVVRLLRDDGLRKELGGWGAEDVRRRYGPERLAREWVEFIAGLSSQTSPAGSESTGRHAEVAALRDEA